MLVADNLYLALYPACGIGISCNSYAIRTDEGIILIDGGLQPEIKAIERQLKLFGMSLDELRLLVATHCHFDHYETFNELRNISGAEVLAHTNDAEVLEAGDYRTGWHVRGVFGLRPVPPVPVRVDRRLEDGEEIMLGGVRLEVIHTPGHTAGCICLYTTIAGRKVLFSGDVVMPVRPQGGKIGWTGSPTLDVETYRQTLRRLSSLEVDWLLAGHESLRLKDGWRALSVATNEFMIAHPVSG